MDDALGPDVHPAAGGHLAVVGNAEGSGAVEVLLIIKGTDHQAVGDDDPGRQLVGMEQAQGMAGHDHQGLLIGQLLQILLDEPVLHPVLADLAGLAVGHQLIGIEGHIKVQVVVDHDLDGLAFHALALVLVDGLAGKLALRTEAVAVNSALLLQLLGKFLCHLRMVIGVNVAQRVFDRQSLIRFAELGFPAGSPAVAGIHLGILRQLIVQLNGHGFVCKVHVVETPSLPKHIRSSAGAG